MSERRISPRVLIPRTTRSEATGSRDNATGWQTDTLKHRTDKLYQDLKFAWTAHLSTPKLPTDSHGPLCYDTIRPVHSIITQLRRHYKRSIRVQGHDYVDISLRPDTMQPSLNAWERSRSATRHIIDTEREALQIEESRLRYYFDNFSNRFDDYAALIEGIATLTIFLVSSGINSDQGEATQRAFLYCQQMLNVKGGSGDIVELQEDDVDDMGSDGGVGLSEESEELGEEELDEDDFYP
jgi:hypothetical protein